MQGAEPTRRSSPQRLPTLFLETCEGCGHKVRFKSLGGRPMGNGNFRVAYLRCPVCGASATQVQELMKPDLKPLPARRKVVYMYQN